MFDVRHEGLITHIVLDRGEKRNAITIDGWIELEKLVQRVNDSNTSAIVFSSENKASFCAGADLQELWRLSSDTMLRKRFRGAVSSAMRRIRAANMPTVALIDGGCFGLGVSLATACDIRVASVNATFAVTPAQFGISYPKAEIDRLVELVGHGHCARLIFGSEHLTAEEAHRIGLVELIDRDGSLGRGLIDGIEANAPNSLRALKAGLLNRFGSSQNFDACFGTRDFAERYGRHRAANAVSTLRQG